MKRKIFNLLKVALGVTLIVLLFESDRFEFKRLLEVRERWPLLLLAQVTFLASFSITIVRWRLLLRALEVPARLSDTFRLGWIGLLFSQLIPGSTGGDVVKGFYVARESPDRRAAAVLSVLLDRVIGLTALMLLGGVAMIANRKIILGDPLLQKLGWLLIAIVLAILLGGALLAWEGFWNTRWVQRLYQVIPGRQLIGQLARALWEVRGKRRILVVSLLLSFLNHCGIVATHLILATALLGKIPSVAAYFFLIPVGQLAFALPISPGGMGVGEWFYAILFERMGQALGAEVAALMRVTWILWAMVGVYFYLRGRREFREIVRVVQEEDLVEPEKIDEAALARSPSGPVDPCEDGSSSLSSGPLARPEPSSGGESGSRTR